MQHDPRLLQMLEYGGMALLMAVFSGFVLGAGAAAMMLGQLSCAGGWQ